MTKGLILMLAAAALATAQMGGMRGAPGGAGNGSLGGMMGGSLYSMMGGGSGLTIGSDGTLYLMRSVPGQGQSNPTASTQLAAIDANGNPKWTLPIAGSSASQPALAKDGTLFVTTSDWLNWMYDWMFSRSVPTTESTASLLVIKAGATSAAIVTTVPLAGQIASAPQIATDSTGNYVVYVVSVDAFSGTGFNNTSTAGSYLYAFSTTGALKYKLQLSQGGSVPMGPGMMGF